METEQMEINTVALSGDCASVRRETEMIKNNVAYLRRSIAGLNQSWEGAAKEEFTKGFQRDLTALDESIRALERFTALTELSGTEYEQCERAVREIVASMRI